MPQMSPLSWVLIFMTLIVFMSVTMTTMSPMKTYYSNNKILAKKENCMKW